MANFIRVGGGYWINSDRVISITEYDHDDNHDLVLRLDTNETITIEDEEVDNIIKDAGGINGWVFNEIINSLYSIEQHLDRL